MDRPDFQAAAEFLLKRLMEISEQRGLLTQGHLITVIRNELKDAYEAGEAYAEAKYAVRESQTEFPDTETQKVIREALTHPPQQKYQGEVEGPQFSLQDATAWIMAASVGEMVPTEGTLRERYRRYRTLLGYSQ